MPIVMQIEGVEKLLKSFLRRAQAAQQLKVTGIVGYTANYGIYVHENLEAFHPVGQAKFLEQPMRQYENDIAKLVITSLKSGKSLRQAILLGCLFLQRESQKLVPVDTGNLKSSAFTKVE